jgi:hypothetical protein
MLRTPLAYIAAPLRRPSPEKCAEDYTWFRERLADPSLLDRAVGVKVDGAVLLAVPAAGCRSGGYLSVCSVGDAVRVWAALRGRPGFPRIRLGLSIRRDTYHTVDWGPRQPWDDAERGRYFGYSPCAIDSFLHRGWAPDPPREATTVLASSRGEEALKEAEGMPQCRAQDQVELLITGAELARLLGDSAEHARRLRERHGPITPLSAPTGDEGAPATERQVA